MTVISFTVSAQHMANFASPEKLGLGTFKEVKAIETFEGQPVEYQVTDNGHTLLVTNAPESESSQYVVTTENGKITYKEVKPSAELALASIAELQLPPMAWYEVSKPMPAESKKQ